MSFVDVVDGKFSEVSHERFTHVHQPMDKSERILKHHNTSLKAKHIEKEIGNLDGVSFQMYSYFI